MMKIGVLSDTHIHSLSAATNFAQRLLEGPFRDVEAIIHAGDHLLAELPSCFYPLPWYGVQGNMDPPSAALPVQRIIRLNGFTIALTHGWGAPRGLEERVLNRFNLADIDVVIYGHSHYPVCHRKGEVLIMNPGSPTDKRSAPFHSVGILTLDETVEGTIVRFD